jgi:CDP-glucose 4,6-dehydratase
LSIVGDVRNLDRLVEVVQQQQPEVVMHLAAQATVFGGYSDPVGTFDTNVLGTVNVLEAARSAESVRALLVVTSDKCYRDADSGTPHDEDEPLGGTDPYSASKACAEIVTHAYRRAFPDSFRSRVGVATARAGNVIGGGDTAPNRLVPDIIQAFASATNAAIRNPGHVRAWQHVLDPLAGYIALCERLWDDPVGFGEAWNFGPPPANAVDVATIAEKLTARWGHGARWEQDREGHPAEASRLRLNPEKAQKRLAWKSRVSLDSALDWTVEWHREVGAGKDAREVTERQILRYEKS